MGPSFMLLLCILATCTVSISHGRTREVNFQDKDQLHQDMSVEARKLPGKCWACKWALNKVKRTVGPNATAESLKSTLTSICNEIGLLKSACHKFVKTHLWELIEELTTTDNVRTICVNTGACRSKEGRANVLFHPNKESHIVTKKVLVH